MVYSLFSNLVVWITKVIILLQILEALLPEGLIVPSAFETVGHIAHLNLRDEHHSYKKLIAKVHTPQFLLSYITSSELWKICSQFIRLSQYISSISFLARLF